MPASMYIDRITNKQRTQHVIAKADKRHYRYILAFEEATVPSSVIPRYLDCQV